MIKSKYILSAIIISFLFLITGCQSSTANNNSEDTTKIENTEEIKTLYKTIDVVITDIDCTWRDVRGAYFSVEYKSDEYGVSNRMNNISNWTSLGHKLESKLNEGDIIQATLYSTVKIINGDKDNMEILKRRLGNIEN